jgi:antirestriction protein ArdC
MPTGTSRPPARRRDIYRESTDAVLASLERGTIPWRQPWSSEQGLPPRNVISGRPYRGINFLQLALAGYELPWWLTFKQASARGARVRKGQHGRTIVKWTTTRRNLDDAEAATARANGQRVGHDEHGPYLQRVFARHYVVFNAEQVDSLDELTAPARDPRWRPEAAAAAITADYQLGPTIHEGGARAYYQPASDHVQMPDRGRFTAASDWHATLFHELAHSTGHRDRLNRRELYSGRFGSPDYAREELTAELAAAMICLAAGIDSPPLTEQHAAYIDHWRHTIVADPRLVTTAAQRAQHAADHILGGGLEPNDQAAAFDEEISGG